MTEPTPQPTPKKSDLGVRTLSAIVMVAVAGTALWLGGWVWTVFVAAVALGVLWEWWGLVVGMRKSALSRIGWFVFGIFYIGLAIVGLMFTNDDIGRLTMVMIFVGGVMATDIGAYFTGRTFGGPKIAPKVSPSKTWSGLIGGAVATTVWLTFAFGLMASRSTPNFAGIDSVGLLFRVAPWGVLFTCIAQAGDFFESWMKRTAGVKDSGKLIPGHGGLFDRVDGLLAVLFAFTLYGIIFKSPLFQ